MDDQSQQPQQNIVTDPIHTPGNMVSPDGQPPPSAAPPNEINQAQVYPTPETHTFDPNASVQTISSPQFSPSPTKKGRKVIILLATLALLLLIGGGAYALYARNHKTSPASSLSNSPQIPQGQAATGSTGYEATVQKFVAAVENKDKATADSLEDKAAQTTVKQYYGTTSFYDSCVQVGVLCTGVFAQSFLSKANITYKDYTASNGTKGKEGDYVIRDSASGAQAGGQGCSNSSQTTLGIAVVPNNNIWLVDNINLGFNANANLCPASGSTGQ